MFTSGVILATVALGCLHLWGMLHSYGEKTVKTLSNGNESHAAYYWHYIKEYLEQPQTLGYLNFINNVSMQFTIFNMMIIFIKYVPTGLYKFLKNIYATSRERIKQKQIELEDIELQIQIVGNKICLREAEFTEKQDKLRQETEYLRKLRMRVHNIITSDETLRRVLTSPMAYSEPDINILASPEQDPQYMANLFKGLKYENSQYDKYENGEHAPASPHTPENSVYSSLSDIDTKQDCRIKIIKVTNVYKVAYLKHFMKQKRLRRAKKRAMLYKQMETIKKQLDDWQASLNTVLNNKLSILCRDSRLNGSLETMDDYSKPPHSSDSECACKNSYTDITYDEYNHIIFGPNEHRNYEEYQEPGIVQEICEREEFDKDRYPIEVVHPGERSQLCTHLSTLAEETSSQVAIETKDAIENN